MINELIKTLLSFVPLRIEEVSWDGNSLTLSGKEWSFSTLSAWRLLEDNEIQFACWDKEIEESIKTLRGLSIIDVIPQGSIAVVDPTFKLSDGRLLEVFSTDTFEPWVVKMPNSRIFVGSSKTNFD